MGRVLCRHAGVATVSNGRAGPLIELLWFAGCPNHEAAREMLASVVAELSPGATIQDIDASDPGVAAALRFPGSPTIGWTGSMSTLGLGIRATTRRAVACIRPRPDFAVCRTAAGSRTSCWRRAVPRMTPQGWAPRPLMPATAAHRATGDTAGMTSLRSADDAPGHSTITVYGAPWCPDCRRAKQFLNEQGVP